MCARYCHLVEIGIDKENVHDDLLVHGCTDGQHEPVYLESGILSLLLYLLAHIWGEILIGNVTVYISCNSNILNDFIPELCLQVLYEKLMLNPVKYPQCTQNWKEGTISKLYW